MTPLLPSNSEKSSTASFLVQNSETPPVVVHDKDVERLAKAPESKWYMTDLTIECTSAESELPALDWVHIVMLASEQEDKDELLHLAKVSGITWNYNNDIELPSSINELKFTAWSEGAGVVGDVRMTKDELEDFKKQREPNRRWYKDLVTAEDCPSFKMSFSVFMIPPDEGVQQDNPALSHRAIAVAGAQDPMGYFSQLSALSDDMPEKPGLLKDCGDLFLAQFRTTRHDKDLDNCLLAYDLAMQLTPGNDPNLHERLSEAAASLLARSEQTGSLPDINRAISMFETVVSRTSDGHPDLPNRLHKLACSLYLRFDQLGSLAELSSAISMLQRAVGLAPEDAVDLPAFLNDLGLCMKKRFVRTRDIADINQVILLQQRAVQGSPDHPLFLGNLGSSLMDRSERTGSQTDLAEAMLVLQRAVHRAPEGHSRSFMIMNNLALLLLRSGNITDIQEAISMQRRMIQSMPEDNLQFFVVLGNLGLSLLLRYERTSDFTNISEAILSLRRAISLVSKDNAQFLDLICLLGRVLKHRWRHLGDLAALSEAISLLQSAVQATPKDDARLLDRLQILGHLLEVSFERTGDLRDVSEAISLHQRVVELTPEDDGRLPDRLNALGGALMRRFDRTGDLDDMDKAVSVQQKAVQLTPRDDALLSIRLNDFGMALKGRFDRTGDLPDITQAIAMQQMAVQHTPKDDVRLSIYLHNLANSLVSRFDCTGDITDLSHAISMQWSAIELIPEDHAQLPLYLNNLGRLLAFQFECTEDLAVTSEAISLSQRAVQLSPEDAPTLSVMLGILGFSLMNRFRCTGDLTDISEAILVLQRSVQVTPDAHSRLPHELNVLAISLLCRFEYTGDLADISEAISLQQRAIHIAPDDHAHFASLLTNLGLFLASYFGHTGDFTALSQAISLQERAVQLTPEGHAHLPGRISSLGISLVYRFKYTGDLNDISKAISLQRKALLSTPEYDAQLPLLLSDLGDFLVQRHEHAGDSGIEDVTEAISLQQRAVQLIPDGHPHLTLLLRNLANSLSKRFSHTHDSADVAAMISSYRLAALSTSGRPSLRLLAAIQWMQWCQESDPSQALEACAVAVELLSQVVGMEQTIEMRHTKLVDMSNLASAAAATALSFGKPEMALEWLEQGRCLVWNQLNQLRTPLDDLRVHHPTVAARLLAVMRALEVAGSRRESIPEFTFETEVTITQKIVLQTEANAHVKAAKEWVQLLEEVRSIPGFQDFLRPRKASDLIADLPKDGVIVVINAHKDRCDALALVPGLHIPLHMPLTQFTYDEAEKLRDQLRSYLLSRGIRRREVNHSVSDRLRSYISFLGERIQEVNRGGRLAPIRTESCIQKVLRALWIGVVRPVFDALAFNRPTTNPLRVWWCVTGPLAFLPIHAAGIYRNGGPCISDFAVSSYTPTVNTLLDKIKDKKERTSWRLLLISQPNTPGLSRIPGTTKETEVVWQIMRAENVKVLRLEAHIATTSRVKQEMASHNWIHLACHAIQEIGNPLKSGFFLHDGCLELSEIMKKRIPDGYFAFLSACQTSTGEEQLSEEAVHLAGGMLAAGYRGVVATMWSILDKYGPKVAEDFYSYLLEEGSSKDRQLRLDCGDSAYALHQATKRIRQKLGDTEAALLTWVPYVHFGV